MYSLPCFATQTTSFWEATRNTEQTATRSNNTRNLWACRSNRFIFEAACNTDDTVDSANRGKISQGPLSRLIDFKISYCFNCLRP